MRFTNWKGIIAEAQLEAKNGVFQNSVAHGKSEHAGLALFSILPLNLKIES